MTRLAVGSVDLDNSNAFASEMPADAGAVRAGALDTDQADRPEARKPPHEVLVAMGGGVELLDAEHSAVGVDGGCNMEVEVGVDAAGDGDRGVLYDGHCHPFQ